jgi:hypothetical protein
MVNSNLKNVAVERTRDDEGRREAANAVSQGWGGGTVESLVIKGAQRRMTKAEGPANKATATRGRTAMGRGSNDIGEQIGRELRGMFDEVLAQPVPDRFLDLLNRLETNTISSKAKAKAPGDM